MRAHKLTQVIQLPDYEPIFTLEDQLKEYKSVKNQIEILELQLQRIKESLFADYFNENTEYKNKYGQVLAKRIDCETTRFDQKKFKEDHEDVYNMYVIKSQQTRFQVK